MFFFCIAEVQPTLSKGSARRAQYKTNSFVFYAEAKPTLSKGSARRARVYQNAISFRCRDVACRVSITSMIHKMLNIKQFVNPVVEGVSK